MSDCSKYAPHGADYSPEDGGVDSHIHVWPGTLVQPAATRPGSGSGGAGVRVVVLDTGIDGHDWLGGSREPGTDREALADVEPGELSPIYGHGTFVAGVIHRFAPEARILGKRLPIEHGNISPAALRQALTDIVEFAPDVVNLSLGVDVHGDKDVQLLQKAVDEFRRRVPGAVLIAAAGNSGTTWPTYPAALDHVTAVGALDEDGRPAVRTGLPFPPPFDEWASNHGDRVDTWELGVGVVSCYPPPPPGLTRCDDKSSGALQGGFGVWEGTSFAAATLSGKVARRMAETGETPEKALAALRVPSPPGR